MMMKHRRCSATFMIASAAWLAAPTFAQPAGARCPLAAERFVVDKDIVRDKTTGLEWSRCNLPGTYAAETAGRRERCEGGSYVTDNRAEALRAVPQITQALGPGWRLPTVQELRAVLGGCSAEQVKESPFGLWQQPLAVWTSSQDAQSRPLQFAAGDPEPVIAAKQTGNAALVIAVRSSRR